MVGGTKTESVGSQSAAQPSKGIPDERERDHTQGAKAKGTCAPEKVVVDAKGPTSLCIVLGVLSSTLSLRLGFQPTA